MMVTLPLRTVSEANQREHWAKRAKRAKGQRATTCMALRANLALAKQHWQLKNGGVAVVLTRIGPGTLDSDNLRGACKAVRDGVADALGINDADHRCRWIYAQKRGRAREYAVEIHIGQFGAVDELDEWKDVVP